MRLTELEPRFWNRTGDAEGVSRGITILCPVCKGEDTRFGITFKNPIGGVPIHPDDVNAGRWEVSGNNYENLTLSPSINVVVGTCGYHWHGFIRNGEVINA
jgi:hypothetical protein